MFVKLMIAIFKCSKSNQKFDKITSTSILSKFVITGGLKIGSTKVFYSLDSLIGIANRQMGTNTPATTNATLIILDRVSFQLHLTN